MTDKHSCAQFSKAVEIFTIMDRRDFDDRIWTPGYYICANDCAGESEEMIIKNCPFCGTEL